MDNEIRVTISGVASDLRAALDGAKGDLGGLKAAIKDVPNKIPIDVAAETTDALERLRALRDMAKDVPNKISIQADADTGVAEAKLRLLKSAAKDTENSIARAQLGGLIPGGGGAGGAGSAGSGLLGGLGSAGSSLPTMVALAPAIAAGLGSITAILGSAGAAMLGFVAATTSAVAILGVGGGSMLGVLLGAQAGITEVTTAMSALETAQSNYGASSKQAQQAQQNLNAAMADAGPQASEIAKALSDLGDQWTAVSAPATQALYQIMIPALQMVKDLMPTVAGIAKTSFEAIGAALDPVFKQLQGSEFKKALTDLGDAFGKLAGPLIDSFVNLMRAFLSVAIAAAPFVIEMAQAFERWTASFAQSLAPGKQLDDLIGGLVGQLHTWFDLATALGQIMVTIFSAGAGQGQSLVQLLTGIVKQWNAWLNTKAGQDAMTKFFSDSADLVVALVQALAPLAKGLGELIVALIPSFTELIKALTPAMQLLGGAAAGLVPVFQFMADELTRAINRITAVLGWLYGAINEAPKILDALGQVWGAVWGAMEVAFKAVLSFILGGISTLLGAIKSVVDAANINLPIVGHLFGSAGTAVSKSLGQAQTAIDNFRNTLKPTADTTTATTAQISAAYQLMSGNVGKYVSAAALATMTGLSKIDAALIQQLSKLGIKATPQVLQGLQSFPGTAGSFPSLTGGAAAGLPKAAGGYIGHPGAQGPDVVPILAGVGEAVLNVPQQGPVEHALRSTFGIGLGDLFGKFAAGGYVYPNSAGASVERTDQGKDFGGAFDIGAIGDAKILRTTTWGGGWGPGGIVYRLLSGSRAGRNVYAEEGVTPTVNVGQYVKAGQVIARAFAGPTGTEEGWANPAGTGPLVPYNGSPDGTPTAGGVDYANFIAGLARGKLIGSSLGATGPGSTGFGGAAWTNIQAPKWTGPGGALGAIGSGSITAYTNAANQFGQSVAGAAGAGTGSTFKGSLSGPVEHQVYQFMSAAGFNKVAIAGMLGNAMQESSMNPNTPGGGLWQQISNFGSGTGGSLLHQMQVMLPQIGGLRVAMNAAGSPGAAATIFEQRFERARIPALANRIAAANAAFRSGYARGGFVGGVQRFAGGGTVAHAAASHPPRPATVKHPKTPRIHVPAAISDALKRLLPADVVHFETVAAGYAQHQVDLSDDDTQLTYTQGLAPYPAQPLVTLTDADAAFLDPTGANLQSGDEIVNQSGGIFGRYYGPGGITGGSFVPGIDQRQAQIQAQLTNLGAQRSAIGGPGLPVPSAWDFYGKAAKADLAARDQRDRRRKRVLEFLRKQVIKAKAIQAELQAITTGNLKANVAKALSRQAIGKRLADLRTHKTTVAAELAAEKHSQSLLIPLEQDPTHTNALQAQLDQINQSIGVETQLSTGGAASAAVAAAKSAKLKGSLTARLKAYATVDTELGGKAYDVGTGGLLGKLLSQIGAIDANRATDLSNQTALAPAMQTIVNAIGSYVTESLGLPGTKSIQVRTPGATTASDAAMISLLQTGLQNVSAALATSQSQFGVLAGFAPLLQGRLLGSLQTGISSVPQTGPYLLHQGETVIPDPGGPQGNRAAATVQTAQGPISIELTFANNEPPLVKLITATLNSKALPIVSDHSGQRARLIAGVRR